MLTVWFIADPAHFQFESLVLCLIMYTINAAQHKFAVTLKFKELRIKIWSETTTLIPEENSLVKSGVLQIKLTDIGNES